MQKVFPVLIFALFFTFNQGQNNGERCEVTPHSLIILCDAIKSAFPGQSEPFYKEFCPCADAFFEGQSQKCHVTQDGFEKFPRCYGLFSSEFYRQFLDQSRINPGFKLVVDFMGSSIGVCENSMVKKTPNDIEEAILGFVRNEFMLTTFDVVTKFVFPGPIADAFSHCVRELAQASKPAHKKH